VASHDLIGFPRADEGTPNARHSAWEVDQGFLWGASAPWNGRRAKINGSFIGRTLGQSLWRHSGTLAQAIVDEVGER